LTAALADLLQRQGHATLAVDFDPQNLLGVYLGAAPPPEHGLASCAVRGASWSESALINEQQVRLLPHGRLNAVERQRFEQELAQQPQWLRDRLAQIDLGDAAVCLIDAARIPSAYAEQALAAADCVLAVLGSDLPSFVAARELSWPRDSRPFAWVLNRADPRRRLEQDLRTLLRATLPGDAPLFVVHRDESVAEAQAADQPLAEHAPHCQAMFDLQAIATWLLGVHHANVVAAS